MNSLVKKYLFCVGLALVLGCGGSGDDTPQPNPTPTPTPTPADSFDECVTTVSNQTLEVVTWNIENFPMNAATQDLVVDIIEDMDADVIAIQEITSLSDFSDLLGELSGWSGNVLQFNGSNLMLGYLYKNSEVSVTTVAENLFEDMTEENDFAFTAFRRPLLTKIRHMNGLEVTLINVHLKCCDGSEDRRRAASDKLKGYIDTNLPDEQVIVLGDFNDEIVDDDNVFQVFLDDAANYRFATIDIASGGTANWSFPSFPSHIDQILITDELFERVMQTETLILDNCSNAYLSTVSDHRPVIMRLNNE